MPISLRFYNIPRNSLSCTFTWCEPSWSPHFRQPIPLAVTVTLGCLGKHIRYRLWCTHPYWGILTNVFFIFPTWWSSFQILLPHTLPSYLLIKANKYLAFFHILTFSSWLTLWPLLKPWDRILILGPRQDGSKDRPSREMPFLIYLRQVSTLKKEEPIFYNRDKRLLMARRFNQIWTFGIVTLIYIYLTFPSEFSGFSVVPNQGHNFHRRDLVRLWFSPHYNSAINKIRHCVLFFFFFPTAALQLQYIKNCGK